MKTIFSLALLLTLGVQSAFAAGSKRKEVEPSPTPVPKITVSFFSCDYKNQIEVNTIFGLEKRPRCEKLNFKGKLLTTYQNKRNQTLDFNSYELYVPLYNSKDSVLTSIEVQDENGIKLGLQRITQDKFSYSDYYENLQVGFDQLNLTNPLVSLFDRNSMMGTSIVYTKSLQPELLQKLIDLVNEAKDKYYDSYQPGYVSFCLKGILKILVELDDQSLSSEAVDYLLDGLYELRALSENEKISLKVFKLLIEKSKFIKVSNFSFLNRSYNYNIEKDPTLLNKLLSDQIINNIENVKKADFKDFIEQNGYRKEFSSQLIKKLILAKKFNFPLSEVLAIISMSNYRDLAKKLINEFTENKMIKSLTEFSNLVEDTNGIIAVERPELKWGDRQLYPTLDLKSELFMSMMQEDLNKDPELKILSNFLYKLFSKFYYFKADWQTWERKYSPPYDGRNFALEPQIFIEAYLRLRGNLGFTGTEFKELLDFFRLRGKYRGYGLFVFALKITEGDAAKNLVELLYHEDPSTIHASEDAKEILDFIEAHSNKENIKAATNEVCANLTNLYYNWCRQMKERFEIKEKSSKDVTK